MARIGIITPVRAIVNEHVGWLEEAIRSVLSQDFVDWEMVIVNDHSAQDLRGLGPYIREDDRIQVLKAAGEGVADARNQAAGEATAKLLLPLDADDKLAEGALSTLLKAQDELGDGPIIIYGDTQLFGTDYQRLYEAPPYNFKQLLQTLIMPIGSMHRKSDWEQVGGWKPQLAHGLEDWEYWIAMREIGVCGYRIPQVTYHYRKHKYSRLTRLRNTPGLEGQAFALMRDMHKDIFNGKDPETMCWSCAGGPRRVANANLASKLSMAAGAPTQAELQGRAVAGGLAAVRYVGRMKGSFFIPGRASQIMYEVPGINQLLRMSETGRTGVDPRDVPFFLAYGGGHAFRKVG